MRRERLEPADLVLQKCFQRGAAMLSSQMLANEPRTQVTSESSSVAGLLPLWGLAELLGRGWERRGRTLEAEFGFPKPSAPLTGPTPSLPWFPPEAVELCGLYDAGVPGEGLDEEDPVPPALLPAHEDHPPVRSLSLSRRGGSEPGYAGPAANALPQPLRAQQGSGTGPAA